MGAVDFQLLCLNLMQHTFSQAKYGFFRNDIIFLNYQIM